MKAVFINGSPRKGWSTNKLLDEAMRGAKENGAETELIHLSDYEVKGCRSCFVCKLKGNKTNGVCAIRDGLHQVLTDIMEADVLVIGSPVYFGNLTAGTLAIIERLLFPVLNYKRSADGKLLRTLPKEKKVGLIITMNSSESSSEKLGYKERFSSLSGTLGNMLGNGSCPVIYAYDTYQFSDYSRYDVDMFDVECKKKQLAEQFPKDLEAVYQLGKSLTE